MKQKIYILGLVTTIIAFTGTIFKINHWPAAGILIMAGLLLLVWVFLPIALINNYKAEGNRQNRILYITTWITCFVIFTAMLFKIQHWPYAGIMLTIGIPFPFVVFLPVFLIVTSRNRNFNIYNTVFVLFLLVVQSVFSTLLALNVSLSRINDSYELAGNYSSEVKALSLLPANENQLPVAVKIDEVLKILDEYQVLILKEEKVTPEQWRQKPGNLWRPDSRQTAAQALGMTAGERLEQGLKAIVTELGNTPGCEYLAKAAPAIFDLEQSGRDPSWSIRNITDNNLTWVLTYLDGVRANLMMIKTSVGR